MIEPVPPAVDVPHGHAPVPLVAPGGVLSHHGGSLAGIGPALELELAMVDAGVTIVDPVKLQVLAAQVRTLGFLLDDGDGIVRRVTVELDEAAAGTRAGLERTLQRSLERAGSAVFVTVAELAGGRLAIHYLAPHTGSTVRTGPLARDPGFAALAAPASSAARADAAAALASAGMPWWVLACVGAVVVLVAMLLA